MGDAAAPFDGPSPLDRARLGPGGETVSEDGQFYWDGRHWQPLDDPFHPLPGARPPAPSIAERADVRPPMTKGQAVFAWVICAGLAAAGLMFAFLANPPMSSPTEVTAQVLDVSKNRSRGNGYVCAPTFAYEVNGQSYTTRTPYYSGDMCGYTVGQTVTLTVDADDPHQLRGASSPILPMVFCLPLLIVAGVTVHHAHTRRRAAASAG